MADQAANLRRLAIERKRTEPRLAEVPAPERHTKIIAVASGKGGVGKTNLAINMGILFAKEGKKVVVMDADLGLANVNVLLSVIPNFNLSHVIKGEKKLHEVMIDTPHGIKIIPGASGFAKLANLSDEERDRFIESIEGLAFADVIIVDTGAGVSQNVLAFVLAADEAIIVTTPEPTAITDAYGIIKSISTESSQVKIKLVVNRAPDVTVARNVAERVINIAGQFLNVKVENLGFVYEDEAVLRSVQKQKPFVLAFPKSRAAFAVDHIVRRLLNLPIEEKKGGVGRFLRSFMSFYKEDR